MILWNDKRVGLQNVFEATKDENLSIEFWSFNREKLLRTTTEQQNITVFITVWVSTGSWAKTCFDYPLCKAKGFFSYLFEFIVDISGSENLFHTGTLKIIV